MKNKKRRYYLLIALFLLIIGYFVVGKTQTLHDIEYTNSNLGISLTFPKTWGGNYKIEERNDSIYVYYTPRFSVNIGLLFTIVKLNSKGEPCDGEIYDSIGSKEIIDINGEKYKFGSTTDVGFPDNSLNFKTYVKMKSESSSVLQKMIIL